MDNWIENYYSVLEAGINKIPKSDFRFYNIGRLPLIAIKTREFSSNCEECRNNLPKLEEIAGKLPEILEDRTRRTSFGEEKNAIESHLSKVHRVRPAHYFRALYTLIGAAGGAIMGLLTGLLRGPGIDLNFVLIFFATGLILGQLIGKIADRSSYRKNLQY